ncbi:MAG TPA: HAD-IC family P-type ATPase, partial [Herpetosiphonaceae bacterium]
ARERGLAPAAPSAFAALPGHGVRATIGTAEICVGSRRMLPESCDASAADALEAAGNTVLWVLRDGRPEGLIAVADRIRPEVPAALERLRQLGLTEITILTGDNRRVAAALAAQLGIDARAELLPEDKIQAVRDYQARGKIVVMIGDGVNDAPALAQADVGIAMGAAGTATALEAAHIALLRDDWALVPEAVAIARRTMRIVKGNIAFTTVYNLVGLSLAALGLLPPVFAAAAQSLPDLGIMANSARLLRQPGVAVPPPAPAAPAAQSCCDDPACSAVAPEIDPAPAAQSCCDSPACSAAIEIGAAAGEARG